MNDLTGKEYDLECKRVYETRQVGLSYFINNKGVPIDNIDDLIHKLDFAIISLRRIIKNRGFRKNWFFRQKLWVKKLIYYLLRPIFE